MTIPAQRSFPYDGTGNDAGPYDADYFALIQQAHLGAYTRRTTAGVLLGVGNGTQESLNVEETSPQSLGVLVREGWAMVNGRSYQASVDVTVPIVQNTDPSGDDRIDSIVVRIDKSTPSGTLVAKQGTVAPAPVPPSLTQNSTVWEIRIADIDVINGATVITTADIDNTVREYIPKWLVKQGGTGLAAIAAGQLIAGNAANAFGAVTAPPHDYAGFFANTSLAVQMAWSGDSRPHALRANGGGAIGTSATIIPFSSADWANPGGLITALASNQFTLEAGTYIVEGFIGHTSDTITNYGFWIAVSSAPTTALVLSEFKNSTNVVSQININRFAPQLLVSTGVELFEVYGERGGAATSALSAAQQTGISASGTAYAREIWFRKIRN